MSQIGENITVLLWNRVMRDETGTSRLCIKNIKWKTDLSRMLIENKRPLGGDFVLASG
jgi:hypothetical protein